MGTLKGGRGVCGGGRVRGRSTQRESNKKKTVEDYLFYVESRKQASDYEITDELNNTFNEGTNVSEVLRTLVK